MDLNQVLRQIVQKTQWFNEQDQTDALEVVDKEFPPSESGDEAGPTEAAAAPVEEAAPAESSVPADPA